MIGAVILAHLVGDYVIQSDWMANEKTKRWWPAVVHGVTYTLPFMFITLNPWALLIIAVTHIIIDRYRLAKQLAWFTNLFGPRSTWVSWKEAKQNAGYPTNTPIWLSTWLLFITDNTVHLLINVLAIVICA